MKKVLGILMLILGFILFLPAVKGVFELVKMKKDSAQEIGFSIGYLGGHLLTLAIIALLVRYGIRFIKEAKK